MPYQSPGGAFADSLYQYQLDRAALQHQQLRDSLDIQRNRREEELEKLDAQEKTYERERKKTQQELEALDVGAFIAPDLQARLKKYNLPAGARKTVTEAGLPEVQQMPASATETPRVAPGAGTSVRAYAGTPTQQVAESMPEGPMRKALQVGAPESVIRIVATEQERKDALSQRASEFTENQANRLQIAEMNSEDRKASLAAATALKNATLAATQAYRQNQIDEQTFRRQIAMATLKLREQVALGKVDDLSPSERDTYKAVLNAKIKAATPGLIGGILNGFSWEVDDDKMSALIAEARNEAKRTKSSKPGAPIVDKVKGIIKD